jgi:sugar lactone lactonase YvrE/PKD repeat protein
MPNIASTPVISAARISRSAHLVGLSCLVFLPAATRAPSVEAISPAALAPASVWARGFLQPRGVAVDSQGAVYVSDRAAGTITRIAPNQSASVVMRGLDRPVGLAFDLEERLLVAEERAGRVTRREADGSRTTLVSGIKQPRWLDVGEDATMFIAARRLTRGTDPEPDDESAEPEVILALTSTGALTVFADGFRAVRGIVAGAGALYAATGGRRGATGADGVVLQIPVLPGARAGAAVPLGLDGSFAKPTTLAQDRLGALFVTTLELGIEDQRVGRALAKLHPDGRVSLFAGELDRPQGMAFDQAGHLYLADGASGRVLRFLAPPAPGLDRLDAITNEPSVSVRGAALRESRVDGRVNGGGGLFTTFSGSDGRFALTIPLALNAESTIETFVTAHRGDGLTGAPAEVTVRHDDVPPETMLISGVVDSTDATTATFEFDGVDDVTTPADLRFAWRFDGRPFSEFSGTRSMTLTDLTDGAHTFDVVARDRAGNVDPTPATRTFTVSRSRIIVADPEPGGTLPAGVRLVRGTVAAGGPEVAVTVNGVAAAVSGGAFAALVPLAPGVNRLQIVASTPAGVVASHEVPITVLTAPDPPFLLLSSPQSGVAPLTVSFTVLGAPDSGTIQADFDGDGTIDFTGQRLAEQSFTYSQPGLYLPAVSVIDARGQRTMVSAIVQVFDRAGLDALLRAKWSSLRDALRRGDITQALTQISERSRSRYQQALMALAPDLPAIDTMLTDVTFVRTRGLEAIFEMSRTDTGIQKSFEVRFHVDTDGFWRVRSF